MRKVLGLLALGLMVIFLFGCGETKKETKYIEKELSPPAAPSNLQVIAVSESQIDLSWLDNSDDEERFELWRRSEGEVWGLLSELSAETTRYSDTGLDPDTEYFYQIRASNKDGCSGFSEIASAITQQEPASPPNAPSGLSASALSSSQVLLTWQDNSDNEENFKVERSDGSGFAEIATVLANQTSYLDEGVNSDTFYSYRICACNNAGCSAYSFEVQIKTPAPLSVLPSPPSNLRAQATSSSQIEISWQDNSDNESTFEVWRKVNGGIWGFVEELPADITSFSDIGLDALTEYFYQVRACNLAGCSSFSETASATTKSVQYWQVMKSAGYGSLCKGDSNLTTIPDMSLNINTTGSPVLVSFASTFTNEPTYSGVVHILLVVDGKTEGRWLAGSPNSRVWDTVSFQKVLPLGAGNHNISIKWLISSVFPGRVCQHYSRILTVIEIK